MAGDDGRRSPVRRLAGVRELVALAGDDPYVRAEADPDRVHDCWAGPGGSLAWLVPSRRPGRPAHLVTLGRGGDPAELLEDVLAECGRGVGSATMPRDADRHLGAHALRPRNDWEWLSTELPPPFRPREDEVRWLSEPDWPEIEGLLARASPRHDALPGRPGVLRWCGIRAPDGELLACAAHTASRPGWPFLASVATAEHSRGQGLGAAVTAWLTRRLLEEGHALVTLGMYSDNDAARRVYLRLGYVVAHEFTSGILVPRTPSR